MQYGCLQKTLKNAPKIISNLIYYLQKENAVPDEL